MSYIVFARKWRPQNFDEVIGQEHITTTLKNAISNNRVAHAYIFTGPRGIGKTSVARIFAKALNCEKGPTISPCNKCISCNSISSTTSMDVIEIDGASNNSVDQVRELRENVKFAPSYGRYKIYIIDEVHMLSIGAFNALLKTLEEPPKHAKFVFATTNPEKVPPTILSRCQRFDFRRVSLKLIISKLKKIADTEKLNISEDAIFSIARTSDGSLRDAESVLDQLASFCEEKINQEDVVTLLGTIEEDRLADVVEKLSKKDTAGLLKEIDGLIISGKDISQFLTGLMGYLRNLMVLKVSTDLSSLIDLPENHIARLKEQIKDFQIEELLYMFYVLSATASAIKKSEIARFMIEASFIKMSIRDEMMSLPEIMDRIAHIESDMEKHNHSFYGRHQSADSPPDISSEVSAEKEIRRARGENFAGGEVGHRKDSTEAGAASDELRTTAVRKSAPQNPKDGKEDLSSMDFSLGEGPIAVAAEETGGAADKKTELIGVESADKPNGTVILTMEAVKEAWPRIIQMIKGEKISAASYLLEGELIKVNGHVLTLGFVKKFNFYKEALESLNNKKFVERIVSGFFKQKIQIEFVTLEDRETPSEESGGASKLNIAEEELEREANKDTDNPIIQSTIEIFDARIVRDERGFTRRNLNERDPLRRSFDEKGSANNNFNGGEHPKK